jgi:Domain of unknown function DUF11
MLRARMMANSAVTVGRRVTVAINVTNNRSAVLRQLDVTDVTTSGRLRILSVTPTRGSCRTTAARRVQCTASTLAPGASMTIHITAQAIAAGTAADRASIVRPTGLATPKNSVATASVRIASPPPPPSGLG